MSKDNYWLRSQMSRRKLVTRGGALGSGAAALMLVGCGGGDDDDDDSGDSNGGGATSSVTPQAVLIGGAGKVINGEEKYLGKTPTPGGTLRMSYQVDPITWDPHQTTSIHTHLRTSMFNSPLLSYGFGPKKGVADVEASANLATGWEQVDPTTVKFTLDPKAVWTSKAPLNGRALKSSDIKFTLERILKLPSPFAGLYTIIDKIETPDDQTVTMKLKQPYAPLFNYLSHYYSQIVAPEVVEKFGDLKTLESAQSLGIGPFELDSWQPSTQMTFKKRANYWREGGPYVDSVNIRNIPDANAVLAAARAGEIDVAAVTWENKDSVTSARKDYIVMQSLSCVAWLVTMRADQGVTKDIRVRQALSLGIDREGWLKSLYNGEGTIDNGPIQALWDTWRVPPGQLGEGDKYLRFAPEEGKKLLEAAGAGNINANFTFTTGYGAAVAEHPELLKDMYSQMGVNLNVNNMEYGAFVGAVMNSKPTYESMSYAGVRFMGDPDEMLWDMYHPTGSKNFAKVNDPEVTALLEKQRQELDTNKRKEVVKDLQKMLAVKLYYLYTPSFSQLDGWQAWTADYRNHVSYDTGGYLRGVWLDQSLKS